ncbi:MAG: hypothetical protein RID91_13160 [Azospirillaceae bacterium]
MAEWRKKGKFLDWRDPKLQEKIIENIELCHGNLLACMRMTISDDFVQESADPRKGVYNLMNRDAEFRVKFEAARARGKQRLIDTLEVEADRRAVQGVSKNVYQKGEQVFNKDGTPATVTEFSDYLLVQRLKALDPDNYSTKTQIHHSGEIRQAEQSGIVLQEADMAALDDQERRDLARLLQKISMWRRRGDPAKLVEGQAVEQDQAALPPIVDQDQDDPVLAEILQ